MLLRLPNFAFLKLQGTIMQLSSFRSFASNTGTKDMCLGPCTNAFPHSFLWRSENNLPARIHKNSEPVTLGMQNLIATATYFS